MERIGQAVTEIQFTEYDMSYGEYAPAAVRKIIGGIIFLGQDSTTGSKKMTTREPGAVKK